MDTNTGGGGNSKGKETIDKKHMENTFQNSKIKQKQQKSASVIRWINFIQYMRPGERKSQIFQQKVHLQ